MTKSFSCVEMKSLEVNPLYTGGVDSSTVRCLTSLFVISGVPILSLVFYF